MELLSEYDGAKPTAVRQNAVSYLTEDNVPAIDFYINGVIHHTRTFPNFTSKQAEAYATLFTEGVVPPNDSL